MQQPEYMAMKQGDDGSLGNAELVAACKQGIDDLRSAVAGMTPELNPLQPGAGDGGDGACPELVEGTGWNRSEADAQQVSAAFCPRQIDCRQAARRVERQRHQKGIPFSNPFASTANLSSGSFTYTRRTQSLTGLQYSVWTSPNLTTWTRDTGAIQTPAAPVGGVETVTVPLTPALLSNPKLFLRLQAAP